MENTNNENEKKESLKENPETIESLKAKVSKLENLIIDKINETDKVEPKTKVKTLAEIENEIKTKTRAEKEEILKAYFKEVHETFQKDENYNNFLELCDKYNIGIFKNAKNLVGGND